MTAYSYDSLMEAVSARLSREGAEHSVRVADTAARLAARYGQDVEDARVAGLLHDWCRDIPGPELVEMARSAGIVVTPVDSDVPYLLHGPVGAAVLEDALPELPEHVLRAVAAHTYGAVDIDPLGMIVYIADTIEPDRAYEGVDDLRAVVGDASLDELFTRTYAASLRYLVDDRRVIHPATVESWNALVGGGCR